MLHERDRKASTLRNRSWRLCAFIVALRNPHAETRFSGK